MSPSATSTRTGRITLPIGPIEYVESRAPDGAPVVLLHGLLMNVGQWDAVLPHLPDTHRYLRPVFPLGGHRLPMNADADPPPPVRMDGTARVDQATDEAWTARPRRSGATFSPPAEPSSTTPR